MSTIPRRPNVLIFCTDEQRSDHLGCMGHPHLKTPNIDRIAAEGTLFRNCYSSSPICMPARATMATGHVNRVHGVKDLGIPLDKSIPTLQGILADAGYRTHAVGKLHHQGRGGRVIEKDEDITIDPERRIYWDWPGHWKGEHYTKFPDNYYGFQTVELAQGHVNYIFGDYVTWLEANHPGVYAAGYTCSNADPHPLSIDPELHYNTWIADRSIAFVRSQGTGGRGQESGGSGQYSVGGRDAILHTHGGPGSTPAADGVEAVPPPDHSSSLSSVSPDACSLTPKPCSPSQPWYLWCSFPDPHEPFAAVKKWSDFYDDVEIELPQNTLALSPDSRSETMTRAGIGTEVIDPELVKKSIKQTYGMISHVDEQIGRVLDCLEEQGLAENTVVMFISDHGDQLGEHGLFFKSLYPYDAHAHIPFIAKVPGTSQPGRVVDEVVSMLDMVPTVLDLAGATHPVDTKLTDITAETGVPYPPALPGEVLTPVLTGDAAPVRKTALVEIDRLRTPIGVIQMRTLVTEDYKLVFYPRQNEVMLFDRKNDPMELSDLADDPACHALRAGMMQELLAELARTEMPAHGLLA